MVDGNNTRIGSLLAPHQNLLLLLLGKVPICGSILLVISFTRTTKMSSSWRMGFVNFWFFYFIFLVKIHYFWQISRCFFRSPSTGPTTNGRLRQKWPKIFADLRSRSRERRPQRQRLTSSYLPRKSLQVVLRI